MKKSIIYIENDKVGFMGISPEYSNNAETIAKKDVPENCKYQIIDGDLDLDPMFLGSVVGKISENDEIVLDYNLDKAKEVWLNHYRTARTPLLEKLDLEYMRADEQGNLELKKEIASKKQALRDVTKTELPNTLEGIKATWPEILGKTPFEK